MPLSNVTVDDISPLFEYSGQWSDSDASDSLIVDYLNSTFHATQVVGASVTLKFNGSAVYLFGAKRGNHDRYTVTLDGQSSFGNGFAIGQGVFQTLLFSATNLSNSPHELVLTDSSQRTDRPFVDVDFATFTTGDASERSSADVTIDDTASSIVYTSGWSTPPDQQSFFFNNSYHQTSLTGANVSIPFTGTAVAVYGSTNTTHGAFAVSIDGAPQTVFNGSAPTFRPQTLLYYASGLPRAEHVITLTNTGPGTLDFDRIVASCADCGSATAAAISHQNTVEIAVGLVALAVLVLLSGAGLLVWLRRRRRQRAHTRPTAFNGGTPFGGDAEKFGGGWAGAGAGAPVGVFLAQKPGDGQAYAPHLAYCSPDGTIPPSSYTHSAPGSVYGGMRSPDDGRSVYAPTLDRSGTQRTGYVASRYTHTSGGSGSPVETDAGTVLAHNLPPPPEYGQVFAAGLPALVPVPAPTPVPEPEFFPLPTPVQPVAAYVPPAPLPQRVSHARGLPAGPAAGRRSAASSTASAGPSRPIIPPIVTDLKTRALPPEPPQAQQAQAYAQPQVQIQAPSRPISKESRLPSPDYGAQGAVRAEPEAALPSGTSPGAEMHIGAAF